MSKRLLKEAGYENGLTIRGVNYAGSVSRRYGEILRTMLKMVNITYKIDYLEYVAASDKYRNLEFDFSTWTAIYIKDPDTIFTTWYVPESDNAQVRLWDEELNSIVRAARREMDPEKRKQLYWKTEKTLSDNYDDAWFSYSVGISATRKVVRGYNRRYERAAKDAYWPSHSHWFKDGIK